MAEVIKVTDQYVIAQANTIRQKDSTSDDLKKAAYKIGDEIGKKIIARCFLKDKPSSLLKVLLLRQPFQRYPCL